MNWWVFVKCEPKSSQLKEPKIKLLPSVCIDIYMYAFSRRFYPKRLTIAFRLYIFFSMCVPWELNPQPFAQLTQCSTTEPHRNTGALNLFNTQVSQFELNYLNQLTFPRHSNLLRCTCTWLQNTWYKHTNKNRTVLLHMH